MPFLKAPPSNAIQCNGPLLYSPNRYVDPNGTVYSAQTEGRYKILKPTSRGTVSWDTAQQILPDGSIVEMEPINAFYVKNKGENKVHIKGLLAYYFVKKIDPREMRTEFIDPGRDPALHASNIKWVDANKQRRVRSPTKSQPNFVSVFRNIDEVNFDEYTEWNGYWVKNDGMEVLEMGNLRVVSMRTGTDGYRNINYRSNGVECNIRINRLIALIHHGPIPDGYVVDHLNGNILDNRPENLEIVTNRENCIRGGNSTQIIKVDPSSMRVVEEIRSIQEYLDEHPDLVRKTLYSAKAIGDLYAEFRWFDTSLEGSLYTIDNDVIVFMSQDNALRIIRERIDTMIESNVIRQDMIPLEKGIPVYTPEIMSIVHNLDPRGIGRQDMLQQTDDEAKDIVPCCRLISFHGTVANPQLVLCLKTLLVFKRSRTNLTNTELRPCPFCVFDRPEEADSYRFGYDDPWAGIPVYTYNHACKSKTNREPLKFIRKYLTIGDILEPHNKASAASIGTMMNSARFSLFQASYGFLAKSDVPKRAKCRIGNEVYLSFFPPVNGLMLEENPDWVLTRRLNCAVITFMSGYFQTKYSKERAAENEKNKAKVAAKKEKANNV